jgi:tellurite resistance protein TerC
MEIFQAAMYADFLGTPLYFWKVFILIVIALLVIDLGLLHRTDREIGTRESFILYGSYMAIAFLFGSWVWWSRGSQSGMEFFTGYLIEQSLSIDNIFVIATIFATLAIPPKYQHRVLFWGILGVIVFRAVLIGAGAALVMSFSWILYLFGLFLVATGVKMFMKNDDAPDLENNVLLKWLRSHVRITKELHGHDFVAKLPDPKTGKLVTWITPLLVALILVEFVDLVFAVDSVPAIFAITTDPFVVYTSNIFAILGLRSLYFALASAMSRFTYLRYSLATLLVLVGAKVFLVPLGVKIPTVLSLGIAISVLAAGILYSLWKTREQNLLVKGD